MDKLRQYLNSLSLCEQLDYARRCGTTAGYLRKAISVAQKLKLDLCVRLDRASAGAVRCEDLRPDVDWAYLRQSQSQKEVA
ncbi:MAG: helix-turn-helix domain-containing protein [Proteobacteria bacterium]|nr:helix-turn-helix domain-containing protein [Pseudomonadota bacterium]MCL2306788.1 helix-turn-helix domain-containing protein [Pseudomonadota bacterium]